MRLCTWFAGIDLDSRYLAATLGFSTDDGTPRILGSKVVDVQQSEDGFLDSRRSLDGVLPAIGDWFHLESGGALTTVALTSPTVDIHETPTSGECKFGVPTSVDQHAIDLACARALESPRRLGHVVNSVVRAYELDGRRFTVPPLGETGWSLRVEMTSWIASGSGTDTLSRAIDSLGFDVGLIASRAVATAESTLTSAERRDGVVAVVIGDESTECATFINSTLTDIHIIPLGRKPLLSELARACKVSVGVLDRLDFGLMIERLPSDSTVQRVRTVMSAWGTALFTALRRRLDDLDLTWQIQAGVVIANSPHAFPTLDERAVRIVGTPARFATESRLFERVSGVSRGSFAALGLIPLQWNAALQEREREHAAVYEPAVRTVGPRVELAPRRGFGQAIGRWLREFVPADNR